MSYEVIVFLEVLVRSVWNIFIFVSIGSLDIVEKLKGLEVSLIFKSFVDLGVVGDIIWGREVLFLYWVLIKVVMGRCFL